jgi:N-succinyl-L-ornithine transcarbamylase
LEIENMKNFISVTDLEDPVGFIQSALMLKKQNCHTPGKGRTLGLIFMNPSLRTRLSTQKAAVKLGFHVVILNLDKEAWSIEWEDGAIMNEGKSEHIQEAASVLSLYCDVIAFRSFAGLKNKQEDYSEFHLRQLITYCTVPVISLESATRHPLQSLADVMTLHENFNFNIRKPKVVLTWAPHVKPLPQAVSNSFCEWMKFVDADFVISNPVDYDLSDEFTNGFPIVHDQNTALENADFVYVKNWSSYLSYGEMPLPQEDWLLNSEKMMLTSNAKIMHCLPVRRNVEIPDFLLTKENSLIIEQAENRTHAAIAVLHKIAIENFTCVDANDFLIKK